MKNLILTTLFLVSCITLGATNSWLGGNGDWNNGKKWSDGTVPTANDIVIINNGTVEISSGTIANALRLRIYGSGGLDIKSGGSLTIDGILSSDLHGVILHGSLTVRGLLNIRNIGNGDGITTDFGGGISVTASGALSIQDVAGNGIRNTSSLNNSGQLSIQNAGNRAILNYGGIDNYGNMNIQYSNGGIFCWANGNVVNSGNLTVVGCNISILLRSNSVGINMHSGQMTLNHAALYAIKVESGNNFFNFGEINSTVGHNLMTICNQGFFHNNNSGSININIATTGMKNWENATFWNDGSVSFLSNMDNQTIWNEGEFVNFSCGELSTYFKWGNYATGTIENEGNWFHNASLSSLNFGQVTNNGVVEDYQGTFPSFSNNEVRARPLTGTLQVGGLVHNALDLGTLSSFTVDGWYTTAALTQSAGRYSTSHNIWQPNGHTSGLSEVFVSLLDNSGNCDVVVRVPIPGGITSFAVPTPSTTLIGEHINPIVYPIPNSGSFTVEMPNDDEGPSKLQLLDMSGRMLWQGAYQLDGPSPVKLPSLIASGVYQLVVRTNEKVMYAERIILER